MLCTSGKMNVEPFGLERWTFRIETFNSAFYIPFDYWRPDFNRRSIYRMNVNSARDGARRARLPRPRGENSETQHDHDAVAGGTMMNKPFRAEDGEIVRGTSC